MTQVASQALHKTGKGRAEKMSPQRLPENLQWECRRGVSW